MLCSKCGYAIPDDSSFCTFCGQEVTTAQYLIPDEKKADQISEPPASIPSKTIEFRDEQTQPDVQNSGKKPRCKVRSLGRKILIALILVVAISAISLNVIQYINAESAKSKEKSLEERISELNEDMKKLDSQIASYRQDIKQQDREISKLSKSKNELILYKNQNSDKVDFVDEHIVILSDTGDMRYHKYDCSVYKTDSPFGVNRIVAIGYEYFPCPICCKEEGTYESQSGKREYILSAGPVKVLVSEDDYNVFTKDNTYNLRSLLRTGFAQDQMDEYMNLVGYEMVACPVGQSEFDSPIAIRINIKNEKYLDDYGSGFKNLSDSDFNLIAETFSSSFGAKSYSSYETDFAKYIVFDCTMLSSRQRRYATVVNGDMIYVFLTRSDGNITNADRKLLREFVDNVISVR